MAARTPSPSSGRSPMVALTGARPATCLTQAAMVSGVSAPSAPCVGILQVDDVGAGVKRQFGFLGVAHAGEEQRQWNSQPNMPPPPPPPSPPPRRAARRLSAAGYRAARSPRNRRGRGRPLPHLAQLNLVLVAVGIGDDDRHSLPVPLRGRVSPGMRFDGDDLIRARVDDGDIFEAGILTVAEIAGVIFQKPDARERVLQQLPLEDLGLAPSRTFRAPA